MQTLKTNQMGESHNAGPVPFILSSIFAFFSFISLDEAKSWVSITAGIAAIGCGIWGWYSHHLKIKIQKQELKNLKK